MIEAPKFICLGAHKSGTSWLFNCLYEHPEIVIKDKIDYFFVDKKYELGEVWYKNHFKKVNQKMTGDLSTVYFFSEKVAKRIYNYNRDLKLIVILRNPIDRAYAHYLQDLKVEHIPRNISFTDALKKYPTIKEWGNYKTHFENYFKYFKKEQLKILLFDDLKNNPNKLLEEVFLFLNVDETFLPKNSYKKVNPARIPKYAKPDSSLRKLSSFLRSNIFGEKLWWKLKHSKLLQFYYKSNSLTEASLSLDNATLRKELYSYYKEDINYIETLLKRENLNWN